MQRHLSPHVGQDYCLCYLSSSCAQVWRELLVQAWEEEWKLAEGEEVPVGYSQEQEGLLGVQEHPG